MPTVKYVDKDSPFDGIDMPEQVESFLARVKIPALSKVNIDTELMVKGAIIFGAFILSAFYKREYDLDISTSAVSDFVDFESLSNDLRKKFPDGAFETDVNIVIYKPMQSFATYNPEIFDEYIAHELWHLVENSYNVLLTDVFIHEATATYVQKVYVGKEVKSCQLAKFNVFGLLYKYGALIVQEELKGESEPLQALLNSEIRERIQLRFDKEVFPKVIDLISVDLCTEDPEDEYILKHEAYAKFRTNPTFENLISGLKTRGLNRFIDEIQGQDTNKFFDHAKRLIAKK
ncbi:hypothetical protein A2335_00820 [Candidatus Peregrinibacteria bacterium RIFOXYB2_FULL_32_7]|nr:MAG: hypothetical protein A2335_00820 [Candidatus Peregrinibacteria bacterium RIFOXYB2_FULL_32_7]